MNKKNMMICSIIICMLLVGCNREGTKGEEIMKDTVNKNQEKVQQITEKLATKQFLMETFQLTEEEIEPYDVEKFIAYFELTEDFFLDEIENYKELSDITKLFQRLQEDMTSESKEENNDFSYLLNAEEYEGKFPDMETVRYLAVSHQEGDGGISLLIDFEKNIIYNSDYTNHIYDNIQNADTEIVLTKENKNEIIRALSNAKIWEWEYLYSDNSEHGMENWWHLGIEFENGIVISYNGAGMTPDNYKPLGEILFNR